MRINKAQLAYELAKREWRYKKRIFFSKTYKKPLKIKGWRGISELGGVATLQRQVGSKYFAVPNLAW